MKKFLLSALLAASIGSAHAQSGYTFSIPSGQAYTTLINLGTSISGGAVWDDDTFSAPIPFTFHLDGRPITRLHVTNDGGLTVIGRRSAVGDTSTGFVPIGADLRDRGTGTAASRSRIWYHTTGTSPSRVFRLEYLGAGFAADSANADTANFQVWLYETSNIVEIRYGASRITPANLPDYFTFSNGMPFVGYFKNVDFENGTFGKLFYLRGANAAPFLDSAILPSIPTTGLANFPASGTVYRFTPTGNGGSTSVSEAVAAARSLKLYPTVATEAVMVEWAGAGGESYQILSSAGALVGVGRLQRGTQSIAVNWLPTGTYNLRVAGGGHVFVKR